MREARLDHAGSIVLVCYAFPTLSETFIVSAFLGLLEGGWDAHVVCWESEQARWDLFPELGRPGIRRRVHVSAPPRGGWGAAARAVPVLVDTALRNPRAALAYVRRGWRRFGLATLHRSHLDAPFITIRPHLIHFEFGPLALGRTYLRDLLGSRIVVSFRGADLNFAQLDEPDYYREVWEEADALHLLGDDLWRRAQRRGCPPTKAHVLIPPGIDPERFDPGRRGAPTKLGTPERPLRILSVGRLVWKKGHEYGMWAIKLLQDRGLHVECRIVGDGAYAEAVALARHELGLERTVHLLKELAPSEIPAQMRWADVLLHAAVSEGFCNAVIEAQAMELPVVCSDADGLAENVADGQTGFVVPRRDARALADKLAVLAGNPGLRRRLGEAGRQRVVTRFRRSDQIAAFDHFYRSVLASDSPRPGGPSSTGDGTSSRASWGRGQGEGTTSPAPARRAPAADPPR